MNQELLSRPDSSAYRAATTPHNSTTAQQPAVVGPPAQCRGGRPGSALGGRSGSGRGGAGQRAGAGAPIGPNQVLIDTSALNEVSIDTAARIAHAGAVTTWSVLNSTAQQHGLVGLAGSSPTVATAARRRRPSI